MAANKRSGLGKGLDTLIPDNVGKDGINIKDKGAIAKAGAIMVKMVDVEPNSEQPRKLFNEDALQELADSIKQYGIIQPLLVQKRGNDRYEIIAGERRWRASKLAGLKEVPVIIKEYTEQEILVVSLIENLQREDLNPIEEAIAYQKLTEEFNFKQDDLAEKVSKSRSAVANSMRLLKLDDRVKQMVIDEMITSGHARALLAIEDKELQYKTAVKVFDEKLNVRDIEKVVKSITTETKPKEKKVPKDDFVYRNLENEITAIIGTKVIIDNKTNKKGKIQIEYYSQDELERIIDILKSANN